MSKQILVIGAGRFGTAVALTLARGRHEVVVVDAAEAALRPVMDEVAHAAIVDATDEEALRRLGIANFDTVIMAIGTDFESGVLATVAARAAGAKRIVAKANSATAGEVLRRVGADEVVRPEHDMGVRLAHQIATPSIVDAFRLGEGHEVIEVEVQDEEALHGRLNQLRLSNRFGVQVVAVTRDGVLNVSPSADYEIGRGDRLVIIGSVESIERFERELGR